MTVPATDVPTMRQALSVLVEADALLTPTTWHKGYMLKYSDGRTELRGDPAGRSACSRCAIGAMLTGQWEVTGISGWGECKATDFALMVLHESLPHGPWKHVSEFNDHRDTTFDDVKAVFARAISYVKRLIAEKS